MIHLASTLSFLLASKTGRLIWSVNLSLQGTCILVDAMAPLLQAQYPGDGGVG